MKRLIAALLAATGLAAIWPVAPAEAISTVKMCRGGPGSAQTGPFSITPQTSPAGTTYFANGMGCVFVLPNDVAWFLSQGFIVDSTGGQVAVGPLVGNITTPTVTLPPQSYIDNIVVNNEGAGSVTLGGIKIGTTSGGSNVVTLISASAGQVS